jgi:hypothetical protein
MAFQTPPTFVDGAVLSASQLNILAANQTYLSGLDAGVNAGFPQVTLGDDESQSYHVVHSHDNLYIYAYLANDDTQIDVYYDFGAGNELVYTYVGATGGETIQENVDLSGFGFTLGAEATVEVACSQSGSTAPSITLYYLAESADEL